VAQNSPAATSLHWGELENDRLLGSAEVLFPRVDVEEYFAEVKVAEQAQQETPGLESSVPDPGIGDQISIDEFSRIHLVVGLIRMAERVPKSKKLIRMDVDLGEGSTRQIVAGIGANYEPEALTGRRAVFVANLKPAVLMGVESRGMILAATVAGAPMLLGVDAEVPPGTPIK